MSTSGISLPAHQKTNRPGLFLGVLAFVVAIVALSAVMIGLLNLDKASSYGLILGGGLIFVASTVWGMRRIKTAAGISIGQQALIGNAIIVFIFLYFPILVLIFFSFNAGNIPTIWEGFSLKWYVSLLNNQAVTRAFSNTMIVTVVSTVASTIIGTMVALAMERHSFRGKTIFDGVLYMPIIIPDIVIALATLLFFVIIFNMVKNLFGITTWGLGLGTIIIAHIAFNISFVATIVRARLVDMDATLEQAAQDLYANEWFTFRRVTLPLLMPAIVSGALLAFTLSLDDFVITFFVSGPGSTTLPLLVYSQVKFGVEPDINALTTLMLLFSVGLVLLSQFIQRKGN